jgi:orotate phosphoribosyltransferase
MADDASRTSAATTKEQQRKRLLEVIHRNGFRRGVFKLTSGRLSPYYIDCRKVSLDPEGAYLIGHLLVGLLEGTGVRAIGGLTLGADPVVTAVAMASYEAGNPISAFIVRKEAKTHGMGLGIEGPLLSPGMPVAIVDDVITTGGSALQAIERAEEAGAKVACVLAIVDRLEGGREDLERRGYHVKPLFTIEDLGLSQAEIADFQRQVAEGRITAP